jgi:hypothetical protein
MPDLDGLTKYAGMFVMFCLILVVGVMVIAQVAPQMLNSTEGGAFSDASGALSKNINTGFSLLTTGIVIFGAVLVLKAMDII